MDTRTTPVFDELWWSKRAKINCCGNTWETPRKEEKDLPDIVKYCTGWQMNRSVMVVKGQEQGHETPVKDLSTHYFWIMVPNDHVLHGSTKEVDFICVLSIHPSWFGRWCCTMAPCHRCYLLEVDPQWWETLSALCCSSRCDEVAEDPADSCRTDLLTISPSVSACVVCPFFFTGSQRDQIVFGLSVSRLLV